MKVNLPDDLLPERGSPKTFLEYSEWQNTEKSLALYLIQFYILLTVHRVMILGK